MNELHSLRERTAVLSNDIASLNRVLQSFGYDGELSVPDPVQGRTVMFCRNELRLYILQELEKAQKPLSSRALAMRLLTADGHDGHDKRLLLDIIRRVGKALQVMKGKGLVYSSRSRDERFVWERTKHNA